MEILNEFIDSIRRGIGKTEKTTQVRPDIALWDYETFREYLLALTKGREYLSSIGEHPLRFDLSKSWHDVLNSMRDSSKERWALIGYEEGQRRLILPSVPEVGLSRCVPLETIELAFTKARKKAGITDTIGEIHSHPMRYKRPSLLYYLEPTASKGCFSLGDMCRLLVGIENQRPVDKNVFVAFVVDGDETLAMFASRETLKLVRNDPPESYESFAKQWYGRFEWQYEKTSQDAGEQATPTSSKATDIWSINRAIAKHYQIALYRGDRDKPLFRDYPDKFSAK
jgi:hypothetical protein